MTSIYDHHNKAFARVSAYVIAKDGERVATIAFKFPADGAGMLWAYVHWLGLPMVRGYAGGYGYDKRTAACASAFRAADKAYRAENPNGEDATLETELRRAFWKALAKDGGQHWDGALRDAGFTVWQAV